MEVEYRSWLVVTWTAFLSNLGFVVASTLQLVRLNGLDEDYGI
jgi:hypothetical protein